MRKTTHGSAFSTLTVGEISRHAQGWLLDGEVRQLSPNTLAARKNVLDKLLWFLRHKELDQCGTPELRAFLAYIGNGHDAEGGRWGNERCTKKVRPRTVLAYFIDLRTFCNFLIDEGVIETSPLANVKPPVSRPDQIQPFTKEQVETLIAAAKRSRHPKRDEAILLFLLDTGVRASELCDLRRKDLDLQGRKATVLGKGNKSRAVFYGPSTARALYGYLREEPREEDDPVFLSDRGTTAGEAMTRSGLLQLIMRLGKAAKIEATRCSPHSFRHTAALTWLKSGGDVFSLQVMLGHTDSTMTRRYVALAEADVAAKHREFSPVEAMKKGRKGK